MRYTLNAKRVSANKLSKKKERSKVRQLFSDQTEVSTNNVSLADKLQQLNEHFMNR